MSGDVFYRSRTKYRISKTEFRKAVEILPFDGPGVINDTVRGPAYCGPCSTIAESEDRTDERLAA